MEEFIEALPVADRASLRARIDFLAAVGNRAREPLSKSLGSGLFELRVKACRIFYCFKPGGGDCIAPWLHKEKPEDTEPGNGDSPKTHGGGLT